jgi:hypothetical protein
MSRMTDNLRVLFRLCSTLTVVSLILAQGLAYAGEYKIGQILPFSEIKPGQLPDAVVRASRNAIKIDNLGTCTGFFISNDGYFMTAMHCVADFIRDELEIISDPMMMSKVARLREPVENIRMTEIEGVRRFRVFGSSPPTLIATGTGFIDSPPNPDTAVSPTDGDRERLESVLEDFAIVKIDIEQPVECLAIAKPEAGEDLYAFGYEAMHGDRLMVSTGNLFDQPAKMFEAGLVDYVPLIDALFDWTKLRAASVKGVPGMSGGPIINAKGQAIGLNEIRVEGVSLVPNIDWIRSKVSRDLGPAIVKKIFNCH